MIKDLLKRRLALLLAAIMVLCLLPVSVLADSSSGIDEIKAPAAASGTRASVSSGSGTWIANQFDYSYSVTTSSSNTQGAAGSVSISGATMTVSATSAQQYGSSGGCKAVTPAADTTTTVTVTNVSADYLKVNTLTCGGSAIVTGISEGDTIAPNATFTVSVTSPANGENATEVTGTVTIAVEAAQTNNTITFLPPQNIAGNTPGSYTIRSGSTSIEYGTYDSSVFTSYTLTASVNSGYAFNGWIVNGKRVSTGTTLTTTFVNETNTVFPDYITSGDVDPLARIAVLESSDTSISKFDVADYYSYYEPSDYQQAVTVDDDHPKGCNYGSSSAAAKLGSYEGESNNTDNQWPNTNLSNVNWTYSIASMTATRSSTAYGDNGYNTAGSAKTNAKVLRILARQTIKVSFDYTVTETYDIANSKDGSARQIAFFYSSISNSDAPLLAALKNGTQWGGSESGNSHAGVA